MIPWLLVLELLSNEESMKLSVLIQNQMTRYSISGEINSKVEDVDEVLEYINDEYGSKGKIRRIDGLSVEFET